MACISSTCDDNSCKKSACHSDIDSENEIDVICENSESSVDRKNKIFYNQNSREGKLYEKPLNDYVLSSHNLHKNSLLNSDNKSKTFLIDNILGNLKQRDSAEDNLDGGDEHNGENFIFKIIKNIFILYSDLI